MAEKHYGRYVDYTDAETGDPVYGIEIPAEVFETLGWVDGQVIEIEAVDGKLVFSQPEAKVIIPS